MLNPLVKPYYFKIRPGVIFAEERLEEEEDGRVEDVLVVLHVHRSPLALVANWSVVPTKTPSHHFAIDPTLDGDNSEPTTCSAAD